MDKSRSTEDQKTVNQLRKPLHEILWMGLEVRIIISKLAYALEERLVVSREYFAVIFSKRGIIQPRLNEEVSGAT